MMLTITSTKKRYSIPLRFLRALLSTRVIFRGPKRGQYKKKTCDLSTELTNLTYFKITQTLSTPKQQAPRSRTQERRIVAVEVTTQLNLTKTTTI